MYVDVGVDTGLLFTNQGKALAERKLGILRKNLMRHPWVILRIIFRPSALLSLFVAVIKDFVRNNQRKDEFLLRPGFKD